MKPGVLKMGAVLFVLLVWLQAGFSREVPAPAPAPPISLAPELFYEDPAARSDCGKVSVSALIGLFSIIPGSDSKNELPACYFENALISEPARLKQGSFYCCHSQAVTDPVASQCYRKGDSRALPQASYTLNELLSAVPTDTLIRFKVTAREACRLENYYSWVSNLPRAPGLRYFGAAFAGGKSGKWMIGLAHDNGANGLFNIGDTIHEYAIIEVNLKKDYLLLKTESSYYKLSAGQHGGTGPHLSGAPMEAPPVKIPQPSALKRAEEVIRAGGTELDFLRGDALAHLERQRPKTALELARHWSESAISQFNGLMEDPNGWHDLVAPPGGLGLSKDDALEYARKNGISVGETESAISELERGMGPILERLKEWSEEPQENKRITVMKEQLPEMMRQEQEFAEGAIREVVPLPNRFGPAPYQPDKPGLGPKTVQE